MASGADPGFKEGGVSEAASVASKAARGVWGHAPPEKFLILMPSRLSLLHSQPILKPKIMTGYANDKPVSLSRTEVDLHTDFASKHC